jgi:hypothetical protein
MRAASFLLEWLILYIKKKQQNLDRDMDCQGKPYALLVGM